MSRLRGLAILGIVLVVLLGLTPPEPHRVAVRLGPTLEVERHRGVAPRLGVEPRLEVAPAALDTLTQVIRPAEIESLDALPADWRHVELGGRGPTGYRPISSGGETCLQAVSRDQASALVRVLDADPRELSSLQWSWRVEQHVEGADLSRREGDDFAARVYVNFAFDSDEASLFERVAHRLAEARYGEELPGSALNYVWANEEPIGTRAVNAYTARTRMVVLRNREQAGEGWVDEARDILEDYRTAFGEEPPAITGIGIMTDTDDTGSRAEACYGELRLSAGVG